MGIKVYDFCCGFGHLFEGWYRSEEEMEDDLRMGRVACPVCGDLSVSRRPSAPNFGKVSGTTRTDVEADAMKALRKAAEQAEDVGSRFPETVRDIHEGLADRRLVKGTCSSEEARALREEGIPVMPLPDAVAGKLN